MTMITTYRWKCAICGTKSEYDCLASYTTFGGPDLDTRPAEMLRGAMRYWIHECPKCGYAAPDISDRKHVKKKWIKSEWYRTCDGIAFASDLARQFYKYYLINLAAKDDETAFTSVLRAAWACDDRGDRENAKHCRELAISLADKMIANNHKEKNDYLAIRADLMRRTGQFDELIDAYQNIRIDDEFLDRVRQFQIQKAREKDSSIYRVEDVTLQTDKDL